MIFLLWAIPIALQIICVVHTIKTGRSTFWIYLIIFLPLAGCAIYFFLEILPDLLNHHKTRKMGASLLNTLVPTRRLKTLEEECLLADTTTNRLVLADEYLNCGFYEKAVEQYQKCLVGLNKDDVYIMSSLAKAHYHNGNYAEAVALYRKILPELNSTSLRNTHLLYIYSLEKAGSGDEAEKEYRALLAASTNLEAMYQFAIFLKNRQQNEESRQLLQEIVLLAKRTPAFNVKENQHWINEAKRELLQ